jgi:hypothetical protein
MSCGPFESTRKLLTATVALGFFIGCVITHSATASNLVDLHQRTMVNPIRAFLIYWLPTGVTLDTSVPDGIGNFETLTQQFFSDISATSYLNIVTQYPGTCGGTTCVLQNDYAAVMLGGSWVDTQAYPHAGTQSNPLLDSDIQNEVTRSISQNRWSVDANTIFFVITGVFNSGPNSGSPR